MSKAAALVALAVLGVSCTGDRPARETRPVPPADDLPRCQVSPGSPPEGFLLVRTREIEYPDHVGVREEYRHDDGRLLVYLLGVTGEMGEGSPIAEEVELVTGEAATLFGSENTGAWSLVWAQDLPCPQVAVVGNGFTRDQFEGALEDIGVIPGP